MNFDPTILPDGIAVSDDPLLSARSATYSESFTRREGERKEPSAISTAETEASHVPPASASPSSHASSTGSWR